MGPNVLETPLVALSGISKFFGPVRACDGIDLELRTKRTHCLLGENGAGKSTLMNVLYGLYHPDAGSIEVRGEPVRIRSPHHAIRLGIGMVHQHFMLVPPLSVLENVILGAEPLRPGMLGLVGGLARGEARRQVAELLQRFGFDLPLDTPAGDLSVGQQQRLEILKTLYRRSDILILDEPTAVLTPQEVESLFSLLDRLKEGGLAVLLTTHKLDEVMHAGDDFTVLRDGRTAGNGRVSEVEKADLVRMMVGRNIDLDRRIVEGKPGEEEVVPVLELRAVNGGAVSEACSLMDANLRVQPGEILGIAGVDGNGQQALEAIVVGWTAPDSGEVLLRGRDIRSFSAARRLREGVAVIPSDRHERALVLEMTVHENLLLGYHAARPRLWGSGGPNGRDARRWTERLALEFNVQPPDPRLRARALSGGNQQKVVVARALSANSPFLLAAQPTRGVDIGAIEFIHERLRLCASRGMGILLISTELSELLVLSHRIQVLTRGRLTEPIDAREATEQRLGELMTRSA